MKTRRNLAFMTVAAACLAAASVMPTHAADGKVDSATVEDVVEEAKDDAENEKGDATGEVAGNETGEASYNIESCEALISDSESGKAASKVADEGVEQLDLDKCKQMIK